MFRASRSALQFALASYAGIGVAVALAAPQIFRTLDDPATAGTIFAKILTATTRVDIALAVLMLLSGTLCLRLCERGRVQIAVSIVLTALLLTIGYYRFSVMPRMHFHRSMFLEGGAMVSAEAAAEHRAIFDVLHKRYTRVYSVGMMLSLGGFALASCLDPREQEPHAT